MSLAPVCFSQRRPASSEEAVGHLELVAREEREDLALRNRRARPRSRSRWNGATASGRLVVDLGDVDTASSGYLNSRARLHVLEVEPDLDVVAAAARRQEPVAGEVELLARPIDEAVEGRAVVGLAVGLVQDRRVGQPAALLEGRDVDERAVGRKRRFHRPVVPQHAAPLRRPVLGVLVLRGQRFALAGRRPRPSSRSTKPSVGDR